MITYPMFFRSFIVRRPGDFAKINELSSLNELPIGSILHTTTGIDGTYGKTSNVVPDMNFYEPYLGNKKLNLYFIKNHPDGTDPFDIVTPDLKAMRQFVAGVDADIRMFRNKNTSKYFLKKDVNELSFSNVFQNVMCHEPLYRMIVTGILQHKRVFDMGLASVINNTNKAKDHDHFVVFKTEPFKVTKPLFQRTFKEYSRITIKNLESTYYMIVMHILGYIYEGNTESYFEKLPKDVLDKLHIVFQNKDKFIIYKLSLLKEMYNRTPAVMLQFLNQLNNLSLIEFPELLEKEDEEEEEENIPEPEITKIKEGEHNTTEYKETLTADETSKLDKKNLEEEDKKIEEKIDKDTSTTPAKKKLKKDIAKKYKEIKVDNKPVEEIITKKIDNKLNTNEIDKKTIEDIPDKKIAVSNVSNFSVEYMEKYYKKDLVNNLVNLKKGGMYLQDLVETDISDTMSDLTQYKAVFKDEDNKQHTIKFTLPKVDADGNCYINGSHKRMTIQRINTPICKVSPSRVSLSSNYNKSIVERNTSFSNTLSAYVKNILNKAGDQVKLDFGRNIYTDIKLPYDYTTIASSFNKIEHKNFNWQFVFKDRLNKLSPEDTLMVNSLEQKYGVYFGLTNNAKSFVDFKGVVTLYMDEKTIFKTTILNTLKSELTGVDFPVFKEWVNLNILNIKLPVIFVLIYRYGLIPMLKYLGVSYTVYDNDIKIPIPPSDILVRFKDKSLHLKKLTTFGRLMLSGLSDIKHKDILLSEMNIKDTYYEIIQAKKLSINYLKGIDDMFDLFIDPITEDVLRQMKEPTNLRDLLIRAVVLLSTDDFIEAASSANFRYRSYEHLNGLVYKHITRALSNYKNKPKGSTNKFSMSEYEVISDIATSPLLTNIDILNPIGDLRNRYRFTHIGDGGRTAESMVVADRRYAKDNVGIVSEASVASGQIGIDGILSANANIVNNRGMCEIKKTEDITPSELLSPSAMLLPGLDMDDGKRMNFVSQQITQYVPTVHKDMARVRTGYERIIVQRSQPPFAYVAIEDGKTLEINEELKTVAIQYKTKGVYVLEYGQEYSKNGGGGFYATQNIDVNVSEGSSFKKGDILLFNSDFFIKDEFDNNIDLSIGVFVNVAFLEDAEAADDGSSISADLSKKLGFKPVQVRTISISKNTSIHKVATPGTFVKSVHPIMIFDESELSEMNIKDKETLDIIAALNKSTPKAKYSGTVVKIEAYHRCEYADMSSSVKKFINSINKINKAKSKYASNANNKDSFKEPHPITNDKIDNIPLDDDTIILKFYIQQDLDMIAGDKLVYDGALKSVISSVMEKPTVTVDDNIPVDAIMSAMAINNRMVMSPLFSGGLETVLEGIEKNALDMYFN